MRAEVAPALPWIGVAPGAPYFVDEAGAPWHPIGHNDAVSWGDLGPLFRRRDVAAVERYLADLRANGVTVLRLMLEYAQVRHRYIERPAGRFSPNMLGFWDDLFDLCARHELRILLTPFDTFWMWLHFRHHPYNAARGGPLRHPSRMLLDPGTREAIKGRLAFATARWGGSGTLFAWDIWNEIHPAQAEGSAEIFDSFIADVGGHLRAEEIRLHGRAHPQTVSLFGPELRWRPHLRMEGAIFRHPALDAATIHIYEEGTIDDPRDTVEPAVGMGRIVRACLAEIRDRRPFFDSEHGPIHTFKDHNRTLDEGFDDEYFRHMQWAHLASGGAGGGMRWPNRSPHRLTDGMRRAQRDLAAFLPLIDWASFDRCEIGEALALFEWDGSAVEAGTVARFGCADAAQAVLYLLSRDRVDRRGRVDARASPRAFAVSVPGLAPGPYRVTGWDTREGRAVAEAVVEVRPGAPLPLPAFAADLAVAIVRDRGRAATCAGVAGRR